MADGPEGFAAAIEEAQRLPQAPLQAPPDLASPFSMPTPKGHRVVDETDPEGRVPGAVVYDDYGHDCEVINLCSSDGKARYNELRRGMMTGKYTQCWEDRSFTKDGDYLIAISWLINPIKKKNEDPTNEDEEDEQKDR